MCETCWNDAARETNAESDAELVTSALALASDARAFLRDVLGIDRSTANRWQRAASPLSRHMRARLLHWVQLDDASRGAVELTLTAHVSVMQGGDA